MDYETEYGAGCREIEIALLTLAQAMDMAEEGRNITERRKKKARRNPVAADYQNNWYRYMTRDAEAM